MAKIISTIKAILTRLIFSAHSMIAIWQVTENKSDIIYWTLCGPLFLLLLEGIFTIIIKKTQEWRWFCPSVFLYLSSIVPAIWLLELDKVERRLSGKTDHVGNKSDNSPLDTIDGLLEETGIAMPQINVDTWTTLIEQFLMLILIVGRWLLPKGDLTRDQLSQLLLVYIGTAADIIEFFDSYKDDSIAQIPLLVYLTLGIWSWSLMQFTIVLSATRARRSRGGGTNSREPPPTDCCNNCCCGIDVWGIVLNVILQDAPFLTFRLLIIFQYNIINYMNVFFTCKNSLVIILQLYRLYVVNAEFWKHRREQKEAAKLKFKSKKRHRDEDPNSIYVIPSERGGTEMKRKIKRAREIEDDYLQTKKAKKDKHKKRKRKDTGYSTASSQNLYSTKVVNEKDIAAARRRDKKVKKSSKRERSSSGSESDIVEIKKSKRSKNAEKNDKKNSRKIEAVIEESTSSSTTSSDSSNSTLPSYEIINEKKSKAKRRKRFSTSSSTSTDASDNSTSSSGSSS